ncbi:MAG: putative oxygen-independent coproporphyrinogen III oxidase [Parasphingorhabdus sp.]|jgi:putative oxygen-independent coproporphyrinogen III oxidase
MFTDLNRIPAALYVHFPWCIRKCPYCDFNSHALHGTIPDEAYSRVLATDIEKELLALGDRQIISIFFGGGTPSLMAVQSISSVIDVVSLSGHLATNAEITLEANPGSLDAARFKGYFDAGVNRLSIGAQSFNDKALKTLGRIHDARQIHKAYETARQCGFENINIDLMFGLPQQTFDEAKRDLDIAFELNPEHISYYQLTLEPNTLFHHQPPELPDDDTLWQIHENGLQQLAENHYAQYEVSAFAKSGKQCQHNLNYWSYGDYIGVGAGAHGKLTDSEQVLRYSKPRSPKDYLSCAKDFRRSEKPVNDVNRRFEYLLNALRLKAGFSLIEYVQRTGDSVDEILTKLQPMIDKELVRIDDQTVRATERGYLYLNDILEPFLP